MASSNSAVDHFTALPPELRTVIYNHLFQNLTIVLGSNQEPSIDTTTYPYQISATSRLLRTETLPILRNNAALRLILPGGHFPESIKRRLPDHIYRRITTIVLHELECDDLKPSTLYLPNLSHLEIHFADMHSSPSGGRCVQVLSRFIDEDPAKLSHKVWRDELCKLHKQDADGLAWFYHVDQQNPREGLERDYIVEGTLWETLRMGRQKRGFGVVVRAGFVAWGRLGGGVVKARMWYDWDDLEDSGLVWEGGWGCAGL